MFVTHGWIKEGKKKWSYDDGELGKYAAKNFSEITVVVIIIFSKIYEHFFLISRFLLIYYVTRASTADAALIFYTKYCACSPQPVLTLFFLSFYC